MHTFLSESLITGWVLREYFSVAHRVLAYSLSYRVGYPLGLPMNVTLTLTDKCYSRCKTCNVWRIYQDRPELAANELRLWEWERILVSLGRSPVWFTITGGEPTLRSDLPDIVALISRHNHPRFLNLATSGIYPQKTAAMVEGMLAALSGTTLTVNISVDEVGPQYASLRGVPDGYSKIQETFSLLHALKGRYPRFVLGANLVLSRHNEQRFHEIYERIRDDLRPDSFVCEVAAKRKAIQFEDDVAPPESRCIEVLEFLRRGQHQKTEESKFIARFRRGYYRLAQEHLARKKASVDCYATHASCDISCTGEVRNCAVRADSLGNLRDFDYDFLRLWRGSGAAGVRAAIRRDRCFCSMANANYTNMLCNWRLPL